MNFKSKVISTAKGIMVWWGIFLILGCCAGFVYKIIHNVFAFAEGSDHFDLLIFIPLLLIGSLVIAILFHIIKYLMVLMPMAYIKHNISKVIKEHGISQEYIHFLFQNSNGVFKNRLLLEACIGFTLQGKLEQTDELLEKLDFKSIIDVAETTGDVYDASIYYVEKMLLCFFENDIESFDEYFISASDFFRHMSRNYRVQIITALYRYNKGQYELGLKELDRIRTGPKSSVDYKYIIATSSAMRAALLIALDRKEEALKYVRIAIDAEVTDYFDEFMGKLYKQCQ